MQLAAVIENVTVCARLLLVSTELGRLLHIIQSFFISRPTQKKCSFQECKQAKGTHLHLESIYCANTICKGIALAKCEVDNEAQEKVSLVYDKL